jgi:hypothetical protein
MSENFCGSSRTHSHTRSLSGFVVGRISALRAAWARRQTMRELEAMPFDVRKDIGWRV